jgi:hypothetical protein
LPPVSGSDSPPPTQTAKNDRPRHQFHPHATALRNQEAVMKKTILTVMLVLVALTAIAAAAPTVHNSDGTSSNYWVHYYHAYYYHPVYFYRPVYVAPVVYPVYTYHYWYYKFAGR